MLKRGYIRTPHTVPTVSERGGFLFLMIPDAYVKSQSHLISGREYTLLSLPFPQNIIERGAAA